MTCISFNKKSIFPHFDENIGHRQESFDLVYRESFRSGSLILPPREGEFMYIWFKFILPNSFNLKKTKTSIKSLENFIKDSDLTDLVKFDKNHALANKITIAAIIAAYNISCLIFNEHNKQIMKKYADFVYPLFNHITHPDKASNEICYLYDVSHCLILKVGSNIILDAKEALSRNDKKVFWNIIKTLIYNTSQRYTKTEFRIKVLENKPVLIWNIEKQKKQKFIIDEYQNRGNLNIDISQAQIISMLKNINPSAKMINSILKVLEICH